MSRFSISTRSLTPSTTFWTSSTSENPRRSKFDTSNVPSVEAVSTPPVPRFWSRSLFKISPKRASFANHGSLTCTPARRPVPRLEGHVSTKPRCSFHINSLPLFFIASSISLRLLQKRVKTSRMFPPFCMDMTRVWSSSFTHTNTVFSSLCQIPRASGQSRAILEDSSKGETGLSNRKWSSINWSCSSGVILFRG